jgi:UPF0176 protein
MTQVVVTFYKFIGLPDYQDKQLPLLEFCQSQDVKGTILLAKEGINATISGSREAIAAVIEFLKADPRLADLVPKESQARSHPFKRMKVKLKKEIVTFGIPNLDPSQQTGIYVSPEKWNELIAQPDVLLLDTRNFYEVAIGTFRGAIDPKLSCFREFPEYVQQYLNPEHHRRVALFCTGGIRCEKASAFLLAQGYSEVYHLQGGILRYLEVIPQEDSLWQGECFVFDERVALQQGLTEGSYQSCLACGYPLSEADRMAETYEQGISCPHCWTEENLSR